MKLDVKCEHCGYGDLKKTNVATVFYCPTCDEEYSLNELEIEEVKTALRHTKFDTSKKYLYSKRIKV